MNKHDAKIAFSFQFRSSVNKRQDRSTAKKNFNIIQTTFSYQSACPLHERFILLKFHSVEGWVDYIGSSHQWWHALVVLALYYWHNTGMLYVEYRMNHGCPSSIKLL